MGGRFAAFRTEVRRKVLSTPSSKLVKHGPTTATLYVKYRESSTHPTIKSSNVKLVHLSWRNLVTICYAVRCTYTGKFRPEVHRRHTLYIVSNFSELSNDSIAT